MNCPTGYVCTMRPENYAWDGLNFVLIVVGLAILVGCMIAGWREWREHQSELKSDAILANRMKEKQTVNEPDLDEVK